MIDTDRPAIVEHIGSDPENIFAFTMTAREVAERADALHTLLIVIESAMPNLTDSERRRALIKHLFDVYGFVSTPDEDDSEDERQRKVARDDAVHKDMIPLIETLDQTAPGSRTALEVVLLDSLGAELPKVRHSNLYRGSHEVARKLKENLFWKKAATETSLVLMLMMNEQLAKDSRTRSLPAADIATIVALARNCESNRAANDLLTLARDMLRADPETVPKETIVTQVTEAAARIAEAAGPDQAQP